ncbi:MAG TPA: hypothetical protein VGF81_04890 [Solirubrobacteraceae bacterium]
MTALINGDSVTNVDGITDSSGNPISLEQFAAQHLGYTVTVVTGAQWDAMAATDFGKYQLLINGDPDCSTVPDSTTNNASTWAPVVMGTAGGNTQPGNRAVVSTDPEFHYLEGGGGAQPTNPADPTTAGAEHLVEAGMHFAGDGPAGTTGFYFDTTCELNAGTIPTLDMLTTTGPGNWVVNDSPPCGGSVQQIASTSEFSIVSDSDIQGWECSDHETWPTFPADWNAQAVATDTPTQPTCGTDPSTGTTACGEAYVLLAGTGTSATSPDLSLSPTTAQNPAGTDHTVTATVVHTGSPVPGTTVTFAISSGPNAGAKGTCTMSDGSSDPGCVTGSDGKVLFTYHDAGGVGTDTINASVTLSGTTEHATATKTWVAEQPITASGTPVSATEGQAFSGNVATFTDPDTSATASEYSATIDWGDGTTSTGTISGSGGSFTVAGSHTYAEEGSYTIKTTITDVDFASNTATASSTATVADAALHATGTTITRVQGAVEGHSMTPVVATFTDADPAGTVSDYTATINWGDGSTTAGKIAASGKAFSVSGPHDYAEEGTYKVTVTIKDVGGATTSATSTVNVADAPLHGSSTSRVLRGSFSGTIARFTDSDPGGKLSDYTARITWGDGKKTAGAISRGATFKVGGSHRFPKPGVYHITVRIKDEGGSTVTVHSRVLIVSPGTATISTPTACVANSFAAELRGKQIGRVTYTFDGSGIRVTTVHGGTLYRAVITVPPGRHHLTVKVTFRKASRTKSRTLNRTVTGCTPVPKFTG